MQQVHQQLSINHFDDLCDEDEETKQQDKKLISTCNAGVDTCDSDTDGSKNKQDSAVASVSCERVIFHLKTLGGQLSTRRNRVEKQLVL